MRLWLERRPSPIGDMLIAWDAQVYLRVLDFSDFEARMQKLLRLHYGGYELVESSAPGSIADPLTRYFAGDLAAIDEIAVMTGGTEFQKSVWAALRRIQAGETLSYGALAQRLGCPRAIRAVGGANGANPIGIVVPCHRVVGANGTLTGYGGGIHRKKWLLAHEAARSASGDLFSRALPG